MGKIPFFDSYWYCYANCTAMLLSSFGYNVAASTIEVLSGVSMGFFLPKSGLPYFSGFAGLPDKGVTKALEILGFSFEESAWNTPSVNPFEQLASVLSYSPAVIGPLDMSYLKYNPFRPTYPGVDHFVLVYKIDGDTVYLNDPAGYAHIYINKNDLLAAWKAEAVTYRTDYYYKYWANPKQTGSPTAEQIYVNAIAFFKSIYAHSAQIAKLFEVKTDRAVIDDLIHAIGQNDLQEKQIQFMTSFSLPLGAKRANHYSQFFAPHNPELAEVKKQQSSLFGTAHSALMYKDMEKLSDTLNKLADTEDVFRELLLKS